MPFFVLLGGKVKNWKKRWVILKSNGFLSYYEKKGGNEKGSIDVINSGGYASSIESSEALPSGTDATAAFSIVTKDRTYTFCSESAAYDNIRELKIMIHHIQPISVYGFT